MSEPTFSTFSQKHIMIATNIISKVVNRDTTVDYSDYTHMRRKNGFLCIGRIADDGNSLDTGFVWCVVENDYKTIRYSQWQKRKNRRARLLVGGAKREGYELHLEFDLIFASEAMVEDISSGSVTR